MLVYMIFVSDSRYVLPISVEGKVSGVIGQLIEAVIPRLQISCLTEIKSSKSSQPIMAEVVGFREGKTLLFPLGSLEGISPGARVIGHAHFDKVAVGDFLIGSVVSGFLQPIDNTLCEGIHRNKIYVDLNKEPPNPLQRSRIKNQLILGVKAIDTLLSFGEGQRIGLMAGSGVGKSVLMGMIAKWSKADINVIALIGERGREVREFVERDLGQEGLKKSVVVVSTSDQSPLMRIRAAKAATAVAEYFSSLNKNVLLIMDSLTRVAQAQREIGLAVGEPPTTKGYPPSVFTLLPKLLERCGPQLQGHGNISGIYTVLVDGDDFMDPIPDNARAILDGNINLSRSMASKGHFPAIDVAASISRVMPDVVSQQHLKMAQKIKSIISIYQENYDFIQLGTYQAGVSAQVDEAIALMPLIDHFLKQDVNDMCEMQESMHTLIKILNHHKV